MRAGPSQEEIRRQNLGDPAAPRPRPRSDVPGRTHLRPRPQPQHHRRAHRRPGRRRPGPRGAAAAPRTAPGGRRWSSGPSPSGSTRTRSASRWTGCTAARVGLGGVVLDRRELARPRGELVGGQGGARRWPSSLREMRAAVPPGSVCVGAGVPRSPAWCAGPTASCGSARTPAGSTSRIGAAPGRRPRRRVTPIVVAQRGRPRRARRAHPRRRRGARQRHLPATATSGIGGGIIAGGRPVTGHGGYGGEVGHMVVNPAGLARASAGRAAAGRPRSASTRCCAPPAATAPAGRW